MPSTHNHRAVRVLERAAPNVTRGSVHNGLMTRDTHTYIAERLAVELSLPVLRLRFVAAGIRTFNLPLADHSKYGPKS